MALRLLVILAAAAVDGCGAALLASVFYSLLVDGRLRVVTTFWRTGVEGWEDLIEMGSP